MLANQPTNRAWLGLICCVLASCAAPVPDQPAGAAAGRPGQPVSSPECLAAKLKAAEPFTASAIPPDVLQKAQSGSVALRYDVVAGNAQNVVVVASNPPGLYDAAALQHARRYRDPSGVTVRGCVMTIDIKF